MTFKKSGSLLLSAIYFVTACGVKNSQPAARTHSTRVDQKSGLGYMELMFNFVPQWKQADGSTGSFSKEKISAGQVPVCIYVSEYKYNPMLAAPVPASDAEIKARHKGKSKLLRGHQTQNQDILPVTLEDYFKEFDLNVSNRYDYVSDTLAFAADAAVTTATSGAAHFVDRELLHSRTETASRSRGFLIGATAFMGGVILYAGSPFYTLLGQLIGGAYLSMAGKLAVDAQLNKGDLENSQFATQIAALAKKDGTNQFQNSKEAELLDGYSAPSSLDFLRVSKRAMDSAQKNQPNSKTFAPCSETP